MTSITISDIGSSILDSRDLDMLLTMLKSENEDLVEALQEAKDALRDAALNGAGEASLEELEEDVEAAQDALNDFNDDHTSLIHDLEDASDEVGEWIHGEALIHEDYWVEYVEELCKDIGDLPKDVPWYIAIDWEKTADNIKMDYSELTIAGHTYFYRA